VAQLGGDEFSILLAKTRNESQVEERARKTIEIGTTIEIAHGVLYAANKDTILSQTLDRTKRQESISISIFGKRMRLRGYKQMGLNALRTAAIAGGHLSCSIRPKSHDRLPRAFAEP